ncbi:hypothetical protein [Amycolatopsis jiangsuensis]|uniref:Uncharacterized protein n=1 Tax=Amycolatopsis jiangsuensis TaxID=1181879 RepID=A0A840IKP5_9PSEU|nr:hypothetical protein [Amycolatopsis jiangsuensis]MBB4682876.1 hypothetical protein [Amycolatopsis jiangsuensis]
MVEASTQAPPSRASAVGGRALHHTGRLPPGHVSVRGFGGQFGLPEIERHRDALEARLAHTDRRPGRRPSTQDFSSRYRAAVAALPGSIPMSPPVSSP